MSLKQLDLLGITYEYPLEKYYRLFNPVRGRKVLDAHIKLIMLYSQNQRFLPGQQLISLIVHVRQLLKLILELSG